MLSLMKYNSSATTLVLACICIGSMKGAQTESDLSYRIPADAERVGPTSTRDPNRQRYSYFPAGAERSRRTVIAIESFDDGKLVEREFFKNGERHGVQQEWYLDGRLKSESPFLHGKRHGRFRVFSEKGNLVSDYTMKDGSGLMSLYNDNGVLQQEEQYEGNRLHGLRFYRATDRISFTRMKEGELAGTGYDFYNNETLAAIGTFIAGAPVGPQLEFTSNGQLKRRVFYLAGIEVSDGEYAKAVASDRSLPPYYVDSSEYKSRVGDETKKQLRNYQGKPRVKIPLELDFKGNPISADL
jgi:antitoxin component YwqK of YwqJK toxin-antitoxin module